MSIHSGPLLESLLATMFRTQSSSVRGDKRCQRLLLWLAMVVSVMTCGVRKRRLPAFAPTTLNEPCQR